MAESRLHRLLRNRSTMGVWLTNSPSPLYYDRKRISAAMQQLQDAGFNRVVPNVWSRGTTFHRSRFAPCLLYTSPSPRDLSTSRMPSSA